MAAQLYGDRWAIRESLEEGGQAHTFLVEDITGQVKEPRVLKRLKNVKRLERFRQEVEAIQRIQNPHVITLIDHDLDTKPPYLVMEYCRGGNLEQNKRLWDGNRQRALELFIEVCDGLAAAHQAGIVHRDIKPENILLRSADGPAVVADFGICYVEEGKRETLLDEAVGAFRFMAPELEDGRADEISPKTDVYSLGKLLYWLLSGGVEFSREKHRESTYNLVERLSDGRLEHVNRLLDRMIANAAHDRLADAREVASEARTLLRVTAGGYNAVSRKIPQPCTYCGQGTYVLKVEGVGNAIGNFGLTAVGQNDWRALVCDQCGHVQLFRVDLAKRSDWWKG
jgi:serine/threonine protein kinase